MKWDKGENKKKTLANNMKISHLPTQTAVYDGSEQ